MIPTMGFMIGAYIFARMVEMMWQQKSENGSTLLTIIALATIFITFLCIGSLFTAGITR